MKKFFLLLIFIYLALAIFPLVAWAIEYPFGGLGQNPSPCEYVKALYIWGLGIIGSLAVVGIAFGGFYYMVGKVEQGKEIIYSSLLGLLLLFGAWLILYTINPELAKLKCPKLETPSSTSTSSGSPSSPSSGLPTSSTPPDNQLSFDPGIQNQLGDASAPLSSLLSCMSQKLPGNVGRISSISDSKIAAGTCSFYSCPINPSDCSHSCNSCHYGGTNCKGKSYAVDFGDQQNSQILSQAAKECNSGAYVLNEGNHIHVSVGVSSGCGCDI